MNTALTPLGVDTLSVIAGEPRVLDLVVAERLGFDRPRDIRKLIERSRDELTSYGEICATVAQNTDPKGRGRPGREYWLNEPQALLICALSRTPQAAEVRRQLITVFMAWRRGAQALGDVVQVERIVALERRAVAQAMHRPSYPQERAIADELGIAIEALFAERYDGNHSRRHRVRMTKTTRGSTVRNVEGTEAA
jgi:lambda repressor-like predicted transcriptional regulator